VRFALPPFRTVIYWRGLSAWGFVMKTLAFFSRTIAIGLSGLLLAAGVATAAEIKVMSSAGFSEAYRNLIPEFERTTGHTIDNAWGPSMGDTPQAVPNRIARGEPVDVVIVATEAIDPLIADGKVAAAGRAELARAPIGAVVRAGAPKPDISTVEAFKRTLLEAKSIAYSDSASGVYLSTVLFPRLGVAEQIKEKSTMIPAEPVAQTVARGEYELGFQTMSELLPAKGVDQLGPIPAETQKIVSFSAAIAAGAKEPAAGLALIKYLSSPEAAPAIIKSGMAPVAAAEKK
jgi:molybdate transport system substrate-binding protein